MTNINWYKKRIRELAINISLEEYIYMIVTQTFIYLLTKKSLFGMPSKREGFIQPSVTNQPPRLTALTRKFAFALLPWDKERILNKVTKLRSHILRLT